jgi:hypothetical protein
VPERDLALGSLFRLLLRESCTGQIRTIAGLQDRNLLPQCFHGSVWKPALEGQCVVDSAVSWIAVGGLCELLGGVRSVISIQYDTHRLIQTIWEELYGALRPIDVSPRTTL